MATAQIKDVVSAIAVLGLVVTSCGGDGAPTPVTGDAAAGEEGGTIPVGLLCSLSGTMAIGEVSVWDAELLAINERRSLRIPMVIGGKIGARGT